MMTALKQASTCSAGSNRTFEPVGCRRFGRGRGTGWDTSVIGADVLEKFEDPGYAIVGADLWWPGSGETLDPHLLQS